jgi:hypothetical protein
MKQLVNFEHFKIINEAEEKLEACLNSISESIINEDPAPFKAKTRVGAALQNPIKFIKLKNNAKRYQKTLVQKALNDLDFEKKKQAAGGEVDADKKEVLAAANKAKNQALSDKEKAIADRMTDLATSPGLQAVKTLAISKAKVAAAEIALKGADGEESKQLKIKIKELNAKASKAQQEIKDYTKEGPAKKVEPESTQREAPEQQELPPTAQAEETPNKEDGADGATLIARTINAIDSKIEGLKKDKQTKEDQLNSKNHPDVLAVEVSIKTAELQKAELGEDKDAIMSAKAALKTAKADQKAAVDTETETEPAANTSTETKPNRPESGKNSKDDMIKRYTDLLAKTDDPKKKEEIEAKIDKLKNESEEMFMDPKFIGLLESELSEWSKKIITESVEFQNGSVADKFKRLMAERLK